MRCAIVTLVASAGIAAAQSPTTGAIQGVVRDGDAQPIAGVTVVVTSPGSPAQTAITDDRGAYKVAELAPGDYLVTFYYLDARLERSDVHVGVQRVTPVYQTLDAAAAGEVVRIQGRPPAIDPTSTTQGLTIDQEALRNLPVVGRSFEGALLATPGSKVDSNLLGIAFSGSTALENQYYVDGVNTTNLTFGTVGLPVINDFIEEIEVISGGYNAEYGRATGAIINVVTKSGSNKLAGSVFGTWQPRELAMASKHVRVNAASLAVAGNTAYLADLGFELGGPIVRDRLWFFVGFAPQLGRTDFTRTIQRQVDAESGGGNGIADVDPRTGRLVTEEVDSELRSSTSRRYNAIAKLNYAATADQQGQLSLQVVPSTSREPMLFGVATAGRDVASLTTDLAAKWTSKLRDGRTEIEATLGWHREALDIAGLDAALDGAPSQRFVGASLGRLAEGFGESERTRAGCGDRTAGRADDPYPLITNCPTGNVPYSVGGPGSLFADREDRKTVRIGLTQRLAAGGHHEIKVGFDVENNTIEKTRALSGGALIVNSVGVQVDVERWIAIAPIGDTSARYDHTCGTPPGTNPDGKTAYACDYLDTLGDPDTIADGGSLNWAAYVRDSWQLQPNLTINAGLRVEEQRARYSSFLRGTVDPSTGLVRGKNIAVIPLMVAPRIGVLYDWTKVGRSKLYAHYGRFYESIPLAINDVGAGNPIYYRQSLSPGSCGSFDPRIGGPDGAGCVTKDLRGDQGELIQGVFGRLVAPGVKGQHLDEIVGGVQLELIDDLTLDLSFQKRWLGSVADVVSDGGRTYVFANPGEWPAEEEAKLQRKIDATADPDMKLLLERQLAAFRRIRTFDRPQRDYSAVQLTAVRRFSKQLYVQASYTYARTTGDYPGVAPDTGALAPNFGPQYDFVELDPNRIGPLPLDRPHYIKVAGYYTADLRRAGRFTLGFSVRAQSGEPENALGAHRIYGENQVFLIPRGAVGRTEFERGLDVHLGYARDLPRGMRAEVFLDLFNVPDTQGTFSVDRNYAPQFAVGSGTKQNANPIVGGTYGDLIWLKALDRNGVETGIPISRNPNFKQVAVYYSPMFARLGARLTF